MFYKNQIKVIYIKLSKYVLKKLVVFNKYNKLNFKIFNPKYVFNVLFLKYFEYNHKKSSMFFSGLVKSLLKISWIYLVNNSFALFFSICWTCKNPNLHKLDVGIFFNLGISSFEVTHYAGVTILMPPMAWKIFFPFIVQVLLSALSKLHWTNAFSEHVRLSRSFTIDASKFSTFIT